MEVITFESKAYQELMLKLERLYEQYLSFSQAQCKVEKENKEEWIDSKAVCKKLNISMRTLYRMKNERLIGYSSLRGHYRFKNSDVEQILHDRQVVPNPETAEELRQVYKLHHKK
jgi:excisionase family DNA binding protein